ncbi:MAG: ribosome maturation factor RimM [Bacillota bacterium]|nr:ribosome maturation factor RimM [Bacillota bacterium]
MQRTDHIVIGKMVSHHGIRGEIKIYPFTDDVTKFLSFRHLYISEKSGYRKLEIAQCRIHKNMPLVKFHGIDTIEQGLHLIGCEVAAERDVLDDGEGGHFIVDLIGLRAVGMAGEEYGVILDVIQNSAQDLYEIKHPSGKKFLVPVVDEFVKEINVDEGYVKLSLIEGLL